MGIVSVVSRQQLTAQRIEREQELNRLASAVRGSPPGSGSDWSLSRKLCIVDLLAFLGAIANTPHAKRGWIEGR